MKKEIKISEVLEMIEQGKTRPEIRQHYGLTVREMEALNNHPQIKGKKAKTPINLVIVDDVTPETQTETQGGNNPTTTSLPQTEIAEESPTEESPRNAEEVGVVDPQVSWDN